MQQLISTKNRHEILDMPEVSAIARIEAELLKGARAYFEKHDYLELVVPHLTKATGSCENMDTLFETKFFDGRAFLCQTGQLYLESMIPYLQKVYCVGSSFRAEPVADNRHLTEFTLIELEFPGDFTQLLSEIEGVITEMVIHVLKNRKEELDILNPGRVLSISFPFKKITYTQAIDILTKKGFPLNWGDDLKSKHEKFLVEAFGNAPLFITHYPLEIKFFNMRQNDHDFRIVNSADLILPFSGESVGAAERHFEYESIHSRLKNSPMLKQLEQRGGSIEDFKWYLDLLKQGNQVPHAGCGIGLNRVTQFVIGASDCRMTTVFPQNRESLM
jgi:asparaginyl-tRNA synthetase